MLGLMHVYDEDVQEQLKEYEKLMVGTTRRQGLGSSVTYSSGRSSKSANSDTVSRLGGFKPFSNNKR
jgi:hypothetical protein